MESENFDFFPMNRALSLTRESQDETDTKLDELIAQVDLLVRTQKEQVSYTHCNDSLSYSLCVFTARCAVVQSAVLRLHVVRPCLSVHNVGGSGPHRLKILETNCTDN